MSALQTSNAPSSPAAASTRSCRTLQSSMCCKCVDVATHSCADCDLLYCLACSDQRHSKGSFQRHSIDSIPDVCPSKLVHATQVRNTACDECILDTAVLHCSACELAYCDPCSKDIHQSGSLQHHSFNYLPLGSTASTLESPFSLKQASALDPPPRKLSTADAVEAMWSGGGWTRSFDRPTSSSSGGDSSSPTFRSSFSYQSWMNPAHDAMPSSTSSDDGSKQCVGDASLPFTSAFSSVSLGHPSTLTTNDKAACDDMGSWRVHRFPNDHGHNLPRRHELSQNQLEDLFSALESTDATRHVLVRSAARHMTMRQVSTIQRVMHTCGDVAHCEHAFAPHGVLLFTYFNRSDAAMAVQRAAAVLDDDDISVDFSMAMPPTSPCTAQAFALGKAIVSVEVNNEPLPSMNDVHAICAQVAAVASVIPLDENSGRFTVEFNDSRDVLEAVSKLNDDSSGGQLAMSAMVAPAPTGHLVDLFHAAAKATTETSTTSQYKFTDSFESPSRREWGPTDPASTVGLSGKHPLLSEPSLYQTIAPTPPRSNESHGNQQNHRPSQVASAYPIASYGATPPTCTQTWSRHQQYSMAPHAAVPLRALPRPSYQYTSPFSPPVVATEYSLGIDRVHKGEDTRTTLMIRNIPNKYTQTMLLAEINHHGHHGSYDFFYLPIDFKNKCNMGYAFINFMTTDAIVPFYNAFNGQRWRNFNSEKVCAISYARLQGKAAMINRFQNSSVLDKHESYRPLVFKSFGPDKGKHEPFPAPRIKPRQVLDNAGPSSSPPRPSLYSAPPPSHHHHHDNFRLYSTAGMYNGPTPLGRPAYPLYHQHHHVSDAGHWRSGAAAQIFSHSNGCSDDAADVSLGGTNGYLDAKHAPTAAPALPALHA